MRRFLACLALLPLAGAALAENFDYSYVEGSYGRTDFDGLGDGDGFGIGGSLALTDRFHVFAGYETGDVDVDVPPFGEVSVDFDGFEVGMGFNTPLSDTIDFVASLAYLSAELELEGVSADEDGYGVNVGLRAMVSPALELNGGIGYADLGEGSGDTSFGAGFLYHFSDAFAAGVGGSWGDDVSSYALTARLSFGQ
ncbi:MAG TPA: outer membrane beta-barrel protein [Woeseiaceae bacterium]|nr:outer membrane beta-barrel protein [Woeseiaceae bacterium]